LGKRRETRVSSSSASAGSCDKKQRARPRFSPRMWSSSRTGFASTAASARAR
jgi:hypothetical protein